MHNADVYKNNEFTNFLLRTAVLQIDFQKWLAVLLQDFKLISSQEKLIRKTKLHIDTILTKCCIKSQEKTKTLFSLT